MISMRNEMIWYVYNSIYTVTRSTNKYKVCVVSYIDCFDQCYVIL